jgi:hypothetical protein
MQPPHLADKPGAQRPPVFKKEKTISRISKSDLPENNLLVWPLSNYREQSERQDCAGV